MDGIEMDVRMPRCGVDTEVLLYPPELQRRRGRYSSFGGRGGETGEREDNEKTQAYCLGFWSALIWAAYWLRP
jgi:hypothetical protein